MTKPKARPISYSRLLRDFGGFRWLWLGGGVSSLGDSVHFVALIWLATQTSSPGLNLAVLATSLYLPGVVLGPFAGAITDRFNRRQLLILADLARIVTALAIPLGFSRSAIWFVAVASLLHSSVETLFYSARNAAVPQVTERQFLLSANGLLSTTAMVMSVAGATLGGVMLSSGNVWLPFGFNAVTFAVSATIVALIPRSSMATPPTPRGVTYLRSVQQGFQYAWVHPPVMVYMLIGVVATIGFAPAPVAVPSLLTGDLGVGSIAFGIAQAISGVGYALGAAYTGRWIKSADASRAMAVGYVAMAITTLALAVTHAYWLALVLIASRSAANAVSVVTGSSFLQAVLPNDVRGRVYTLTGSVHEIPRLAILPVAGLVTDSIGVRVVFVVMSVFILAAGLIAWQKRAMLIPPAEDTEAETSNAGGAG